MIIELHETDLEEIEQTQVRGKPVAPAAAAEPTDRPLAKRELDLPALAFLDRPDRLAIAARGVDLDLGLAVVARAGAASRPDPRRAAATRP